MLADGRGFTARVRFAATPRQRLRGLRPAPRESGLLLYGGSVHGRGMTEPLTVLFVDASGMVLAIRRLAPGGLVHHPGATWTVELPEADSPPPAGARLEAWAARRIAGTLPR